MEFHHKAIGGGWVEAWTTHPTVGLLTALKPTIQGAWSSLAWYYRDATRNPTNVTGCGFPCKCKATHGALTR